MKIIKKVLANILCAFIPGRSLRTFVRLELANPIRKWIRFAKSFSSNKHPRIRRTYGFRRANFVITVDDKYVFKFPIRGQDGWDVAEREKRITDALRPISPIKIPKMEIFDCDGVAVRRYEFIRGIGWHSLDKKTQVKHVTKIAKQIANFLYVVGNADPVEIRDLKPIKNDKPSIMHGWNQNDLWENFILNPETFDVLAVIDWEGAGFNDFYKAFTHGGKDTAGRKALLHEYLDIYKKKMKIK
ncbi:MAG: hypothetical protein K6B71_00840 [Alphaproteobacteria bacterium]|nr:hypothetical protein [Alphaproteobacteria bacterium]